MVNTVIVRMSGIALLSLVVCDECWSREIHVTQTTWGSVALERIDDDGVVAIERAAKTWAAANPQSQLFAAEGSERPLVDIELQAALTQTFRDAIAMDAPMQILKRSPFDERLDALSITTEPIDTEVVAKRTVQVPWWVTIGFVFVMGVGAMRVYQIPVTDDEWYDDHSEIQ